MIRNGTSKRARRMLAGLIGCGLVLCQPAGAAENAAQPLVQIDGFMIDTLHFALFASQTGRNPESAQDQIRLLNELVNNVMVANSSEGKALAKQPEVAAALEVARVRLLAQTFVRTKLEQIEVDDAEIQARYDATHGDSAQQEFKARHILLASEPEAQALIAQLEAGADFAKLAEEHSIGPSKSVGGDLGWFGPDQMVSEFAEATAQLADAAFTRTPVQTRFGWHIILREDSRNLPPPTLDAVREELEREIKQQKIAAIVAEIRNAAEIEVQNLEKLE